jgi:putative membrane protein
MSYDWGYQGMGGGGWALMMVGMIIFWAILVFGIVALVRHNRTSPGASTSGEGADKAVAILRERLARGEVTPEEYTALLAALRDRS